MSSAKKTAKLEDGSHTAIVSRPRPATSAGIAAASNWCVMRQPVNVSVRTAPSGEPMQLAVMSVIALRPLG
jgi:hypothetical protein